MLTIVGGLCYIRVLFKLLAAGRSDLLPATLACTAACFVPLALSRAGVYVRWRDQVLTL